MTCSWKGAVVLLVCVGKLKCSLKSWDAGLVILAQYVNTLHIFQQLSCKVFTALPSVNICKNITREEFKLFPHGWPTATERSSESGRGSSDVAYCHLTRANEDWGAGVRIRELPWRATPGETVIMNGRWGSGWLAGKSAARWTCAITWSTN